MPLEWRIHSTDPGTVELAPGWLLFHPLTKQPSADLGRRLLPLERDSWYLQSRTFFLGVPVTVDFDVLLPRIEETFVTLRVLTRNPRSPTEVGLSGFYEIEAAPPVAMPTTLADESVVVRWVGNRDKTCTTMEDFAKAFAESLAGPPPVYAVLALDAVAGRSSDYRRTVLYAAMSVEILAATLLDNAYEAARESPHPSRGSWHLIDRTLPKERKIRRDPIYEALRSLARRNTAVLLHELPLYALGRSLMQEDEALYSKALVLQRARNELAHSGTVSPKPERIELNQDGADEALGTARSIFAWFQQPDYFVSLDTDLRSRP
jgi:hypothetical protein